MITQSNVPIDVVDLLPILDKKLLKLLKSLQPEDWEQQTVAKLWTVKDVAAHLLDGNIRMLSILRDHHFGEALDTNSYQDLVDFLNRLNLDWIKAMKRASPQMLIFLLELTGQPFCDYLKTLKPFDKSVIPVAWSGEMESKNWMEIARQYTEKWLHQQQIRAAFNKPGLMTAELYYPFIDIFMLALPHTYQSITADEGAVVKLTVTTNIGGSWYLLRTNNIWKLRKDPIEVITTEVIMDPETSWKLFSKSLRPEQVKDKVEIHGDQELGKIALTMLSVMA